MKTVVRRVQDAWQSALVGLGISGLDKGKGYSYSTGCELDARTLADVYRSNWLARKAVDALPQRALARGFSDSTPMPEAFQKLNYAQWDEGALQRAISLGRLNGGAHLFVGYADGGADPRSQVMKKGNVAFLDVFTRFQLVPATINGLEARDNNPLSPTAGQVQVWKVVGDHPRANLEYHVSRAIPFGGLSLPPLATPGMQVAQSPTGASSQLFNPYYRDWSDSVLRPVWDDLQRYGVWWQSVGHLMSVASVGVLKVGALMQSLFQNDGAVMKARIDLANQMLSLTRCMMLDADKNEEYDRKAVSFADIPQLLDQMMIATAGAFDMPATELFGRAPQGMNATGESDHRMWEARVEEWCTRVLSPRVDALAEAIGGAPVHIEYPEVHIATDEEQAALELQRAQRDQTLFQVGAFSAEEIRNAWQDGTPVEESAKDRNAPEVEPPPVVTVPPNANSPSTPNDAQPPA